MIILHSVFWYQRNELITTKQNINDKYLLRITQLKISPGIWQHGRERRRWANRTHRRGIKTQRDRNDVTQLNGEGGFTSGLMQYSHAVLPVYWENTVNIQPHTLCTFTHAQYCSTVVLCLSKVCFHVSCDTVRGGKITKTAHLETRKTQLFTCFCCQCPPVVAHVTAAFSP